MVWPTAEESGLYNRPIVTPSDHARALSHATVYIGHRFLTPQGPPVVWMEELHRNRGAPLDPFMFIIPLAGMATGIIISIGFFKTVRHVIDRKLSRGDDGHLREEIADLQSRIEALESEHGRVDELEDRLEFAERLLIRERESGAAVEER